MSINTPFNTYTRIHRNQSFKKCTLDVDWKKKNLFSLTEKVICVWTRGQNIQENISFAKYLQKCGHGLSRKKYIWCLFHFFPLQLQQESWLTTRFCSKASSSLQQCFVLNHRNLSLMFTTQVKAGEKKRRFLRVCQILYTHLDFHTQIISQAM